MNATEDRPAAEQTWLSPKQVMTRTGFSRTEVYAALRDGSLPSAQSGPGGRYRIRLEDADEWVRNRRPSKT